MQKHLIWNFPLFQRNFQTATSKKRQFRILDCLLDAIYPISLVEGILQVFLLDWLGNFCDYRSCFLHRNDMFRKHFAFNQKNRRQIPTLDIDVQIFDTFFNFERVCQNLNSFLEFLFADKTVFEVDKCFCEWKTCNLTHRLAAKKN